MRGLSSTTLTFILGTTAVIAVPRPNYLKRDVQQIGFDCTPPHHTSDLPLFSLEYQATFPEDILHSILKSAAPGANVTEKKVDGSRYYYDGDLLIGYFNDTSGETSVFPKLGLLQPGKNIDTRGISQYVSNVGIVPNDDTKHSIVRGKTLAATQITFGGRASAPADYLLESIIQRNVPYEDQTYAVCGPGTKASFKFGADGTVKSLQHKWRAARSKDSTITPLSQDSIQRNIESQLSAASITSNVTVKSIELCFYDSGNQFIQPVFRYNATVTYPFGFSDEIITGYIPAGGEALEPLPSLNPPQNQPVPTSAGNRGDTLTNTTATNTTAPPNNIPKRQEGGITVGRYVMRGDALSPQMVTDANYFWEGLSSTSNDFINSQYYWEEPFIYENDAWAFVDDVNLAFSEGHGNVDVFATDETLSGWGPVYIPSSLPSNGYGPGAGGSLAYWIIRSCLVVQSVIDYPDSSQAFTPWWPVMNGMHAILGYRTDAQADDGSDMENVGSSLANGVSVLNSWLNGVGNTGYASIMLVCGHDDDTVFDIGNVGKATCLKNVYQY